MLYPFLFKPVFQERIWGGRNIERLYRKPLPANVPIGESWEICDRADVQSEISNGPLAGKTLHWLMQNHRGELMGKASALHGRFPLLVKILDAEEKLSLQVHPPAEKAQALKGEAKTEMWYIAQAKPSSELYVGLRKGATRQEFESKIADGSVETCFHRVRVKSGDAMFLPSGRVHAIGSGLVIFEIQQNSDTTYRVFDWNRVDAQGTARQLHVKESLECIDFEDFEPEVVRSDLPEAVQANLHIQTLVEDPLFEVEVVTMVPPGTIDYAVSVPHIVAAIEGNVTLNHASFPASLAPGQFCLVPACVENLKIEAAGTAKFLVAWPGQE
ncbi:MAG TPA: type I phosphomannose isomerase catalytic subunit [Candidatus Kapabacteria bacterium]|nr:type I phosphomannose isomerase catalytic subunit [Candidatus Kapabacteria bacterium]